MLAFVGSARPLTLQTLVPFAHWTAATDAHVLVAMGPDWAQVWDSQTTQAIRELPGVSNGIISRDGRLFAYRRLRSADIDIIDLRDGSRRIRIRAPGNAQSTLAFSPDDRWIAIDRSDDRARIVQVDTRTGRLRSTLPGASGDAAYSNDGATIATLDDKRDAVLIWDSDGALRRTLRSASGAFGPVVFSPNGRYLLTIANEAGTPPHSDFSFHIDSTAYPNLFLNVWDMRSGRVVRTFPFRSANQSTFDESTGAYAFVDDTHVAVSGNAGWAFVADIRSGETKPLNVAGSLLRNRDGIAIMHDVYGKNVDAWMRYSGGRVHAVMRFAHAVEFSYLAVSPDGFLAALAGNRVAVWNLGSGALQCETPLLPQGISDLTFTDRAFVVRSWRGSSIIDRKNGCALTPQTTADQQGDTVTSPDGTRALAFPNPPSANPSASLLEVRNARTHALLGTIGGIVRGSVLGPVFSMDGSAAALRTTDGRRIGILDAMTGRVRAWVPAGASVAISPDGRTLAATLLGKTVLYDGFTGAPRATYDYDNVRFAFAPNGRYLIANDNSGGLRITKLNGEAVATFSIIASDSKAPTWVIATQGGAYRGSSDAGAYVRGGTFDPAVVRSELNALLQP